MKTRLQLWG